MKNAIFALLSLLLSLSSFAYDPEDYCTGRMSSRYKRKCHEAIERGRYFDSNALSLCRSILDDVPRVYCFNHIRDRHFDRGAIDICSKGKFNSEILQCLRLVRDKSFDQFELRMCGNLYVSMTQTNYVRMNCIRKLDHEDMQLY